jgi:hypothetical protein
MLCYARRGVDATVLVEFIQGPFIDADAWPASLRYVNQFPAREQDAHGLSLPVSGESA